MVCCWCEKSIQSTEEYAILNVIDKSGRRSEKCGHCSCFQCLSKHLATTPITKKISCPKCKKPISSHCVGPDCENEILEHRDPVPRNVYENPSKEKDPLRHFMKHERNPSGKVMVYLHVWTKMEPMELPPLPLLVAMENSRMTRVKRSGDILGQIPWEGFLWERMRCWNPWRQQRWYSELNGICSTEMQNSWF